MRASGRSRWQRTGRLGGLTVYIGTCNGGARTYHTWLDKASIVISATSVGTKRFGEQLVGNLRP